MVPIGMGRNVRIHYLPIYKLNGGKGVWSVSTYRYDKTCCYCT